MTDPVPARIRDFIQSHFTLTLATAADDLPWAAGLYYVADEDLNLYFISDPGTRHVRDALRSGCVAVTIHDADLPWTEIRGVQMEARLEPVAAAERAGVERRYLERFPDVATIIRSPADATQSRIAEKFRGSAFYRIIPGRLRYIDNTRGFGKPEQIEVSRAGLHRPE